MQNKTETDRQLTPVAESAPVLKLLYTAGTGLCDRQSPVTLKGIRIGRLIEPDDGLDLAQDRRASARHARVFRGDDKIWIVDEGSKNGTWVNGQEIKKRWELTAGDVIRIGNSLLLLSQDPALQRDAPPEQRAVHDRLRGTSPALREVRYLLWRAAQQSDTVLLLGETGTGKELAARSLHAMSGRSGDLVAWNCANTNAALAESQLFGHARGAFTGAQNRHIGLFREAAGRTLFLDEIGELPIDLQPKLLRALEARAIRPVGSDNDEPCEVHVVAATNRDLQHTVRTGGFRADLFARLSTLCIALPPLRERREDILPLFLTALGDRLLTARLCEALLLYPWPFNVRELLKVVAHARAFGDLDRERELDLPPVAALLQPPAPQQQLSPPDLTASLVPSTTSLVVPRSRTKYTPELVERLMREEGGVLLRVAERLGLSRRQLNRILEKFSIEPKQFRRR